MKSPPKNPVNLVDQGFMDARWKLLDIAAFLDRLERNNAEDDYRVRSLYAALEQLGNRGAQRTENALLVWSDTTTEPIPAAHTKGASGAWEDGDSSGHNDSSGEPAKGGSA